MIDYDVEIKLYGRFSIVKDSNTEKYWIRRDFMLANDIFYDPKNDFQSKDNTEAELSESEKIRIKQKIYDLNSEAFIDIWGMREYDSFGGDSGRGDGVEKSVPDVIGGETMNNSDIVEAIKELKGAMDKKAGANPYEEQIVNAIVEKGKNITSESLMNEFKPRMDSYIRDTYGYLPQKVVISEEDKPDIELEGLFHEEFGKILKVVKRRVPLMLVGPAGSGKNHTLEQVAEALGLDFYFTNAVTQEYKLTGFIDANGTYQETQFYHAFKDGGLFFLDEMDASVPEVLVLLNAAIANGYFDFPTGRINAHENFRIVSAANTVGRGASMEYTGRSQLDAATLDRFAIIDFGYDPQVEYALAADDDLYNFIIDLREIIASSSIRYVVSMRATINTTKLVDVMEKQDLIKDVILKGMDSDDMMIIANKISSDTSNEYEIIFKDMVE